MSLELPVLHLGLAGFAPDEQQSIECSLRGLGESAAWRLSSLNTADAWWLHGRKTRLLDEDRIRINAAEPSGHAVQLHLPDVNKPVAFAEPVPEGLGALLSFDATSPAAMGVVLQQFESWLSPVAAQFCLAAHLMEHQGVLGLGTWELWHYRHLVAVVNMKGEVAVRGTAGVREFENSVWRARTTDTPVPDNFVRTSLSQLMWQYALRTQRDLLPAHYRRGLLYFRRPPRMPQRMLGDAHLLLMRQLSVGPAAFRELQRICHIDEAPLARDLAALYVVGSITSNPKRAANPPADVAAAAGPAGEPAPHPARTPEGLDKGPDTDASAGLFGNTRPPDSGHRRTEVPLEDMTAPAPLR